MGILIPTQTLTGPQNPVVSALTGLTQGLAQGIPIAEQIKRRKEESDRQNIELAQQQGQLNRRNSREDASKRAAALLMQAAAMNAGAPNFGPGVSSPSGPPAGSGAPALPSVGQAEEQGPGTAGKPLEGPPEGQYPDQQQQGSAPISPGHAFLLNEFRTNAGNYSMEDMEHLLGALHHDESLQAVTTHANRIGSTIQRGLDKGAYDAVDEDGHPDPSATIEMQNIQQRIQSLDRTDPRAAAALLDQAEQAEAAARQYKAHAEMGFARRQGKIQGLQNRMAQIQANGPPSPADEPRLEQMQRVLSLYTNHVIDEKQLAAMQPDAEAGLLDSKQELMQARMEAERAKAELEHMRAMQGPKPPPFNTTEGGMRLQSELDTKKGIAISKSRVLNPAKPPSRLSNAKALESIATTLDKEFPKHGFKSETPEEAAKYQERKKELEKKIGFDQPDTGDEETSPQARDFLYRIQQGEFGSEEELRKAMEEAGVTEDEIHAAAGGK